MLPSRFSFPSFHVVNCFNFTWNFKHMQANSGWLYIVPWGINKAVTYVKERYGNPYMFLSENGIGKCYFLLAVVLSFHIGIS